MILGDVQIAFCARIYSLAPEDSMHGLTVMSVALPQVLFPYKLSASSESLWVKGEHSMSFCEYFPISIDRT